MLVNVNSQHVVLSTYLRIRAVVVFCWMYFLFCNVLLQILIQFYYVSQTNEKHQTCILKYLYVCLYGPLSTHISVNVLNVWRLFLSKRVLSSSWISSSSCGDNAGLISQMLSPEVLSAPTISSPGTRSCSTVQYSTVQSSTVQYSPVRPSKDPERLSKAK